MSIEETIPANIADMLNEIKRSDHNHFDSKMLYNMVKLFCSLTLKKGKLINLKIGDVIDQNGQVKNEIQIGKYPIPLSKDDEQLIINHIKHLSSNQNYKNQSDAFLFQNKKGEQYSEATRQLRNSFKIDRPFQKLREASIKNKALSSGKQIDKVAKSANISPRQVKAIITQKKIPAGEKTSISEKLHEIWKYTKEINKINEIFQDHLKDQKIKSKEFIKSIHKNKKIPDDLKGGFFKEVSEVFNKNKIVINAKEISEVINKNKLVIDAKEVSEVINKNKLVNDAIDGSISLSSHKNISNSKMIKKIVPKDKKYETFEKLLWLRDQAVIFPTSDINEVDRYKDLFLETLSTLSYYEDPQENQNLKKSLMNSFADAFFQNNVVFNNEIGSPYIWDKKKEDKDGKIILTGLIKQGFKEDVSGKLDESLLSILKESKNEDLKPLVTYILKNRKESIPSLEILSYYFDDYLTDLKKIAECIQKYQRDEKILGIERLAPYSEVACFVADNLKVNYHHKQAIDIIEFKILEKILEYSWMGMDDSLKRGLLRGEEFYKISLIIANALSKSELNNRLTINRDPTFVEWVQEFEDVIGKSFKKISIDSLNKGTNFFETLTYVIHIAMLRQLQKRRTILFRNFKQFRFLKFA